MKSTLVALLFLFSISAPTVLFAQATKSPKKTKAEEEEEKPKLGNIAGGGGAATGGSIDFVGEGSEGTSVIGGSLSKVGGRWVLKLVNNTKQDKSYNATVEVQCHDKNQRTLGTSSYSYSLSPGQQFERNLTVSPQATNCMMNLVKAKDTTRKKKEDAVAGDGETDGAPETGTEQPS